MTPAQARELAKRLKAERIKLGLSAHEVARRAGVNVGTVTRIEKAQIRGPRVENLLAIGAVLDIPPGDILSLRHVLPTSQLPSLGQYLRTRFAHLPESAFEEIERVVHELADRYRSHGPVDHEDEY